MSKKQRLAVLVIALCAGLVGGLFSSFLLQGSSEAHASSAPVPIASEYSLSAGPWGVFVVSPSGDLFYANAGQKPKKLGRCQ